MASLKDLRNRIASIRASARRSRAEATSSNALVIFCVLPTERIRRFRSWTVAIC